MGADGESRLDFAASASLVGRRAAPNEEPSAESGDDISILAEPRFVRDQDLFRAVVEQHHVRFAQLAFMLCGNRQQAEDAVAEAYARVWPRFRRGRIDDLVPYLRRAVVNQINGGFRRRFLERREEQRQTIDLREHELPQHGVEDRVLLGPAMRALPDSQRAVIVLRYIEDLSEEETADLLGIKLGTVKSRAARALEQLRRVIGEEGRLDG